MQLMIKLADVCRHSEDSSLQMYMHIVHVHAAVDCRLVASLTPQRQTSGDCCLNCTVHTMSVKEQKVYDIINNILFMLLIIEEQCEQAVGSHDGLEAAHGA